MTVQFRAELCHVDTLRCVVRVEAWENGQLLASSLGEAESSEAAEDRARQRLATRIGTDQPVTRSTPAPIRKDPQSPPQTPTGSTTTKADTEDPVPVPAPAAEPAANPKPEPPPEPTPKATAEPPSEAPTDPEDWSEELTAIDLELRRIGWDRDLERTYLERAFGHASRHRLTRYADLVAFLRQLRGLQPGDRPESAPVPIRRNDLISQGDQMLRQLSWGGDQARGFLQQHLGATSRQQLSDEQLLQFNMLLEEQTLKSRDSS
jgi:hypothetical protein